MSINCVGTIIGSYFSLFSLSRLSLSDFLIHSNRIEKFDHFSQPKHGYDNVDGGGGLDSPTSFDGVERPPLRHIDKYVRAELFGLSARYTVALMAMMGFIISFGMKCNLSPAKMERDHASWNGVSKSPGFHSHFSCFVWACVYY